MVFCHQTLGFKILFTLHEERMLLCLITALMVLIVTLSAISLFALSSPPDDIRK
jgi:hypothetical protein